MVQDGYLSCEEFVTRLPRFLDHDLPGLDHALMRLHLEACERCLAKHRFERAVLDGIRDRLRSVEMPPDFKDRVLTLIAAASAAEE